MDEFGHEWYMGESWEPDDEWCKKCLIRRSSPNNEAYKPCLPKYYNGGMYTDTLLEAKRLLETCLVRPRPEGLRRKDVEACIDQINVLCENLLDQIDE